MNELSETTRNIGLLETSITMQSFSAVAMETQADAAEMMIREEESRKDAIIEHLFELHAECVERMQEVNELIKSAAHEYSFYIEEAWTNRNDRESAQICQDLAEKALNSSKGYSNDWQNLYDLSKQILSTIAGESSPRTLPATTADDLPFESAQPAAESAVALSMDTFDALVKTHIGDVISYVEHHRDLREPDETALTEAVITEISRGKVNAEDVLQSFDEVLDERYAAFYEHLNERYAQNPKFYQSELAQCVEAYA